MTKFKKQTKGNKNNKDGKRCLKVGEKQEVARVGRPAGGGQAGGQEDLLVEDGRPLGVGQGEDLHQRPGGRLLLP